MSPINIGTIHRVTTALQLNGTIKKTISGMIPNIIGANDIMMNRVLLIG